MRSRDRIAIAAPQASAADPDGLCRDGEPAVYARGIAEDFLPALGENPCEVRATLEAIGSQCAQAGAARTGA